MLQKTLKSKISFNGVGIHTGKTSNVTLFPAAPDSGIIIKKSNLVIPVTPDTITEADRCSIIKYKNSTISTPEHLLSALNGMGITNCEIQIDGDEIPILDGSSIQFCSKIKTQNQKSKVKKLKILKPYIIESNDSKIIILPNTKTKFSYFLEFDTNTHIQPQYYSLTLSKNNYIKSIAKSRTWGFENEIDYLRSKGLALGGSLDNAIVITSTGYSCKLNYNNELARHKILDMVGDFAPLNRYIQGHIIGIKSGHALNIKAVKSLYKDLF